MAPRTQTTRPRRERYNPDANRLQYNLELEKQFESDTSYYGAAAMTKGERMCLLGILHFMIEDDVFSMRENIYPLLCYWACQVYLNEDDFHDWSRALYRQYETFLDEHPIVSEWDGEVEPDYVDP
jgi:hypothetical protein